MIRSMTAYASSEQPTPWGTLVWELRSVNHRYLETSLRLPEDLRGLEPQLRERLAARLQRGKVEVSLRLRGNGQRPELLRLNRALAERLAGLRRELAQLIPDADPGTLQELLAWPGMIEQVETDAEGLHAAALESLERALDALIEQRGREGARMAAAIHERLDAIEAHLAQVRQGLPGIAEALRQRLLARLQTLPVAIDAGRIEQELVLGLQKIDVAEELDRLDAHLAEARRVLALDAPVGRRLDFLMQEFNREANTLGSKSVDWRSSQIAVELKVLIEQMREQVQNLE